MRFQNLPLPDMSKKIGETSWFTELTIPTGLLNKHMAPKGKLGLVIVKEGSCDFVWEDNPKDVISIDKDHPLVIEPERYHHVIAKKQVVFKVEFYVDSESNNYDESANRPGQNFI